MTSSEGSRTGDRDLNLVRELNPQLQTFRDWLAMRQAEIPID